MVADDRGGVIDRRYEEVPLVKVLDERAHRGGNGLFRAAEPGQALDERNRQMISNRCAEQELLEVARKNREHLLCQIVKYVGAESVGPLFEQRGGPATFGSGGEIFIDEHEPHRPALRQLVYRGGFLLRQGHAENGVEQLMGLVVTELQVIPRQLS